MPHERGALSLPDMRDEVSGQSFDGSLREMAVRSSLNAETVDLADVWRALCLATMRIIEAFHTDDRCFLVLSAAVGGDARRPLRGRNLEALERALNGSGSKIIAMELGASESTISFLIKQSTRQLGFSFGISNMPTLLMMAAHAARGGVRIEAQRSALEARGQSFVTISAARPDRALETRVSAAEYAVAQLLVEGHPYSKIAALRGTSARTVANQVSAVFRKLDVSGRTQLVGSLLPPGADSARGAA